MLASNALVHELFARESLVVLQVNACTKLQQELDLSLKSVLTRDMKRSISILVLVVYICCALFKVNRHLLHITQSCEAKASESRLLVFIIKLPCLFEKRHKDTYHTIVLVLDSSVKEIVLVVVGFYCLNVFGDGWALLEEHFDRCVVSTHHSNLESCFILKAFKAHERVFEHFLVEEISDDIGMAPLTSHVQQILESNEVLVQNNPKVCSSTMQEVQNLFMIVFRSYHGSSHPILFWVVDEGWKLWKCFYEILNYLQVALFGCQMDMVSSFEILVEVRS